MLWRRRPRQCVTVALCLVVVLLSTRTSLASILRLESTAPCKHEVAGICRSGGALAKCINNGGFERTRGGHCPGKQRCCLTAPKPSASSRRHVLTKKIMDKLLDLYPSESGKQLKRYTIGGAVDDPRFINTCVIRMSHSFNLLSQSELAEELPYLSHYTVPLSWPPVKGRVWPSSNKRGWTVPGKSGLRYALRVAEFEHLMRAWFGPPITIYPKNKVGKHERQPGSKEEVWRKNYKESLNGKRGIIMFDTRGFWQSATGHFDLFDAETYGPTCSGKCYFRESKKVFFWPAKDEE